MLSWLIFAHLAGLQASYGTYVPICRQAIERNTSSPELPTFPPAFSTSVEVNIVNKNYTAIYKEFYDLAANKGTLQRTRDGKTTLSIYDYSLDERIDVDVGAKNCSVSSIYAGPRHFNFFGNNHSHIESVSQLFHFAKRFNETYMGVVSIRGIKCNHWRACVVHNNSSYNLDYFFSVPGWKTSWPNATVVRAVINGTSSRRGALHDFYHVYDFFNFRPGSPNPSEFQLPSGYFCVGLKGLNKTVPKVPPAFTVNFEMVFRGTRGNRTFYVDSNWQEIYDLEKKLFLLKHPNWFSHGQVVTVHDFNTGISYNISTGKSGPVCKISALSSLIHAVDVHSDGHHHIRMKTTHELFNTPQRNGSSPLIYKGSTTVRGIDVDIWVGKGMIKNRTTNESTEVIQEYFFSKPKWIFMAGSQLFQTQVPVRLDMYTSDGQHYIFNMFNFDTEAAETTAFDIKPCFNYSEQRYIQFNLDGDYVKYAALSEFRLLLSKTISKAANVSIIRVNGLRLLNNEGKMTVVFIFLNKTKPVVDAEVTVYPENGLMDAVGALNKTVTSGEFKLNFQTKPIQAEKSSFREGLVPKTPPSPASPTDKPSSKPGPGHKSEVKTKGLSSGAAAGISILMLVVGIFGGLVIAHVIMKRRGTSLFQYQRQE
ncbi:uncharacterized protein LOC111324282 [Stylophora pistillata]|uniref:uncharacterized protein LOC111324282 n=1 Tax=Stylophora pistillata TaxID=50429 RepID=UPI000C04D608|nr:uncharacterized protein LOC111324282 [Stylophora pistillata]